LQKREQINSSQLPDSTQCSSLEQEIAIGQGIHQRTSKILTVHCAGSNANTAQVG
jgi:hypothetical protein